MTTAASSWPRSRRAPEATMRISMRPPRSSRAASGVPARSRAARLAQAALAVGHHRQMVVGPAHPAGGAQLGQGLGRLPRWRTRQAPVPRVPRRRARPGLAPRRAGWRRRDRPRGGVRVVTRWRATSSARVAGRVRSWARASAIEQLGGHVGIWLGRERRPCRRGRGRLTVGARRASRDPCARWRPARAGPAAALASRAAARPASATARGTTGARARRAPRA